MTNLENLMTRSREPAESLSDHSTTPCRTDALSLLAMLESLKAANPKLAESFQDWRLQVDDLLAGTVKDDLDTERQLEALAMEFRLQWITLAHSLIAGVMKSPSSDHIPLLPISLSSNFLYERVLRPTLEKRVKETVPDIPGWDTEITVFSSGMAAISAAITVLRHKKDQYRRDNTHTLQLDMFGGYFETLALLDLLDSSDLNCQSFRDEPQLLDRFGRGTTDILFLELIAYDWKQTVVDPARFIQALDARPSDLPWILILDTTLIGPIFQLEHLLMACGEKKPLLVLEIRSGLKLEQMGLEFSNVGIVKTLSSDELDDNRYMNANQFHRALTFSRGKMGTSLSLSQVSILDAPWVFHPEWTLKHTHLVMDNNRILAFALSELSGLFSRVNHPALGPQRGLTWAESPIVVMEFHEAEDKGENHDFLLAVIAHEVRQRKLVFQMGASFGFRHHRCEIIQPSSYDYPDGRSRGFFKVALGARLGPSLDGVILLMQELAAFADFKALKLAYPQIKPEKELAGFPDMTAIRMIR
jgi:hypothetical protein